MSKYSNLKRPSKKTGTLIVLAVVLLIFLVGMVLSRQAKQAAVTIPSTSANSKSTAASKPKPAQVSNKAASSTVTSTSDKDTSGNPVAAGSLTLDSAQTFVSNHKPGQNGSPTSEQSVCNTTPGASCHIQFTKGSLVKSLDTKVADSNGVAVWSWDVKDAGFSSGSWQISAIANLSGQTKTATDPTPLEIQ
jgi:cytoskeletal protein RodZ